MTTSDDLVALCTRLSGLVLDLRNDEQNDAADDVQKAIDALASRDKEIERLSKERDDRNKLAIERAAKAAATEALAATATRERDEARAEVERLRKVVKTANDAIAEYVRYLDGGEMRGSYDGKPERNGLRKAGYATRAALTAKGGENAEG